MPSLFDLFCNAADYSNEWPDMFGRSRLYNSSGGNIFQPVLSERLFSLGLRPEYPGNKRFAVCLSHDIDKLFLNQSSERKMFNAAKSIMSGHLTTAFRHAVSVSRNLIFDDYNLKKLIEINQDLKSTFYFLSLLPGETDFNYRTSAISDQISYVKESGGEIGLHGGHGAYNNVSKLQAEKKLLESDLNLQVAGYRNHFLRFELPTTWNILQESGFEYDSTLGYADSVGFRNGMCYPFLPYDIQTGRFLEIVELPLIIMDATLFYYMRLDFEVAFDLCKKIIQKIMNCGGVLTLLWHNNFLTGEMGRFYLRILNYLKSLDTWFATSAEVVDWWKEQGLLLKSTEILKEIFRSEGADLRISEF